jgi:hypothetical protein
MKQQIKPQLLLMIHAQTNRNLPISCKEENVFTLLTKPTSKDTEIPLLPLTAQTDLP